MEQKTLIAAIAVIKDLSDTPQSESNTNVVKVKQGKTRGPQQKKKRKKPSVLSMRVSQLTREAA